MPFIKISGLTTATAVSATNQFEINQNSTSRSATVAQVAAFARGTATDTVVLPAGTVSAPGLTFTGDTNTGIYSPAADTIAFAEGGVEAMRIDSSGNVGIGTSSPAQRLDVAGSVVLSGQSTAEQFIRIGAGRTGNGFSYLDLQGDTTYNNGLRLIRTNGGANSNSSIEHRGTGNFQIVTQESAPIVFYTNGINERMRIDNSRVYCSFTGARGASGQVITTPDDSVANAIRAAGYIEWSTDIGAIGTTYFVSDESKKENIQPSVFSSSALIARVNLVSFDWKPESGQTGHVDVGVSAQQLQSLDARLVRELSDGTLMVHEPALVAHLLKAVQELIAKNEALEARVAVLENK